MDDFIEMYEGALDAKVCAELVAAFEASDKVVRGRTTGGVNTRLKDSWDLHVSSHPEWKNAENLLNVRQTKFDPLLLRSRAPTGAWTVDAWAPTDGFVRNGGVRFRFGGE